MKDAFLKYIQLNTLNHFFISMVDFRLISTKILLVFVFPFMTHVDGNPKYYEDNLEKTHGRIIYSSVVSFKKVFKIFSVQSKTLA